MRKVARNKIFLNDLETEITSKSENKTMNHGDGVGMRFLYNDSAIIPRISLILSKRINFLHF